MQTFAEGVDHALLKARGTGVTSTYVSTVAVGGTTFAQPAVEGEISSDQGYFDISYAGATGITVATLTASSTYVYIDKDGNLQQQTSAPTRQDFSRKVFTMRIAVDLATNLIIGFEYLNNPIGHYANSIRDLYTYLLAQGVPFKRGMVITGRSGDLGFDVGAGTLMEFGGTGNIHNANIIDFDAVSNTTFFLATRTGFDSGGNTNLPQFWDNGSANPIALGSTTVVGHRLYRFSNGNFVMQYGQGNYANLTLAKAGVVLEDYVLNPILKNATFFGWWLIESTATNTSGTTLTDFSEYTIGIQGGSSGSLAGCLLKGNNLSDLQSVAAAQVNLDLEPGVDVQAYSSILANTTASFTSEDNTKLDAIEASADVTDTVNVVAALTAGTNVAIAADGTISSTDTNTTYSVGDGGLSQINFTSADHTKLNGIEASATADQTAAQILTAVKTVDGASSGLDADLLDGQQGSYYTGYTDTAVANIVDSSPETLNTLNELAAALGDDANFATTTATSLGEKLPKTGGAMTGAITTNSTFDGRNVSADGTKLDGIEASADVTDTTNVVAALTAGTNVAIATNGTISSTDTNTTYSVGDGGLSQINFTSADHTKLNGIEASADVTDTTNVVAALTAGTNVAIASNGTISSTDTNTTYSSGDFSHDALSGFVANEHINHTSVTLTAGAGMTGGGTIAASRTFNVAGVTSSMFSSPNTVLIKNASGTTLKTIRSPGS